MRKTFIFGVCLTIGFALTATGAFAWGPGFGPKFARGFGGPASGVPPFPDLTAEQSSQIQALRDEFQKQIEPVQGKLFTKRVEFRDLLLSQNPDQAALKAKQKEIWDLQSKLREQAVGLRLEIRKVLKPEQLAELQTFNQGVGFGPGPGFGPRMGFGPPIGMRGTMSRW